MESIKKWKSAFWLCMVVTFLCGCYFYSKKSDLPEQWIGGALGMILIQLLVLFFCRSKDSRKLKAYKFGAFFSILMLIGVMYGHISGFGAFGHKTSVTTQTAQYSNNRTSQTAQYNSLNSSAKPTQTNVADNQPVVLAKTGETLRKQVFETLGVRFSALIPDGWSVKYVENNAGILVTSASQQNQLVILVGENTERLTAKDFVDATKEGMSQATFSEGKNLSSNRYLISGELQGQRVEILSVTDYPKYYLLFISLNDVPVMTDIVQSVFANF